MDGWYRAAVELRLVRYFVNVVDAGSVTAAARLASVAQPSLSRQLRRLEADLGVALFEREGGRLRLGPAGRAFLPMARDLVARADRAGDLMRAVAGGTPPRLTVVAPATTVADIVAPFLATQGPDAPTVTVGERLPSEVFAALTRGEADLGVSSGSPPAGLEARRVISALVFACVPGSHPWAREGLEAVPLADLVAQPIIALGPEHGTRRLFDQAVASAGFRYRIAFETNVPQVAQALAASGRGVAIVTDDPRYGLVPLAIRLADGTRLRIPLVAAWDPTHYAAGAIGPWVDELAEFCVALYGPAMP